jgi:hypothetical protein
VLFNHLNDRYLLGDNIHGVAVRRLSAEMISYFGAQAIELLNLPVRRRGPDRKSQSSHVALVDAAARLWATPCQPIAVKSSNLDFVSILSGESKNEDAPQYETRLGTLALWRP